MRVNHEAMNKRASRPTICSGDANDENCPQILSSVQWA